MLKEIILNKTNGEGKGLPREIMKELDTEKMMMVLIATP